MSVDRAADLLAGAQAGAPAKAPDGSGSERARLARLAAEFESMLLVQMLRDMRTAGRWDEAGDSDTLGAETFYQTIDVELASHLSRVQGFGLGRQLLAAFDRALGSASAPVGDTASGTAALEPGRREGAVPTGMPADPAMTPAAGSAALSPPALDVPAGTVTSAFGWRRDPLHGAARFHKGIDLRAAYGDDVRSAGPGRVVFSGQQGGYGTTVVVEHAGGFQTRYAHLSATLVTTGDEISGSQVLGRAGRSGRATGTHLHFEVLAGGRPIDPRQLAAAHGLKTEDMVADLRGGTAIGVQETAAHDHQD